MGKLKFSRIMIIINIGFPNKQTNKQTKFENNNFSKMTYNVVYFRNYDNSSLETFQKKIDRTKISMI